MADGLPPKPPADEATPDPARVASIDTGPETVGGASPPVEGIGDGDDVDGVLERLIRVELGDNHAVAVLIEHVGHAHQHHVVVVHKRHGDRSVRARGHAPKNTALRV